MKALIICLVIFCGLGLAIYFNSDSPSIIVNNTSSDIPSQVKIGADDLQKLKEMAKINGLKMKENHNNEENSNYGHSHDDVDFGKYLTKEQKNELYEVTNRSHDGLVVEVLEDGSEVVDLKKRFSHAHVSVIDENGVKRTGEYSQTKKVE